MAAYAETISKQRQSKSRERLFYIGMVIAIVITVFAGFSRTFYLRPYFQTQALIPLLILHGVVFSSWIVLLVTQTTLVATKRMRTHMRLGIAGGLLASLITCAVEEDKFGQPHSDQQVAAFHALLIKEN